MGRQSERRRKGRGERGPQGGRGPPAAGLNRLRPLSACPPRPCSAFLCPKVRRVPRARRQEGAAAPGRAARRSGRSCFCRGGEREPPAGARSAALTPRPAAPPARRAPGGRSERFQMWRRRAGPGARRGAHGAGRAAPTRARPEPPLAPPPAPRPACRPDTPLAPRPGPRVLRGPLGGEASGAQLQEGGGPSAHLESLRIGPLRETAKGAAAPRLCLVDYDQGGCTSGVDAERRGQRERAREAEPPGEAAVPRCLSRLIDPGFLNSSEDAEHVCYHDILTFSS